MKFLSHLKRVTPFLLIIVLTLGVLNFGSYDPYNELGSLTPSSVFANQEASSIALTALTASTDETNKTEGISNNTSVTSSSTEATSEAQSKSSTMGSCKVWANTSEVYVGSDITISWETKGFTNLTLNGVAVTDLNGSKTFTNLQENTTYTLVAKSADGKSDCTTNVKIKCLPKPPAAKFCELTLHKSVDKTTAKPGDELNYTIKIKNTGTANCTGGGVRIVDIHDPNLTFISESHSANILAGYNANHPLYKAETRTLSWNGTILTPGEEGTITWKGKVKDLACGTNIKIKNTAKATAKELNNFGTWSFSNTVVTDVSKSCEVPMPSCDAFTATPSIINKGESVTLAWQTTNATKVAINNGVGEVAADGSTSVSPLANTEYILTVFGQNYKKATCKVNVTVKETPQSPTCTLTPTSKSIKSGESVDLTWTTTNASSSTLTEFGNVDLNGTKNTGAITTNKTYVLNVVGKNGQTLSCKSEITVTPVEQPITCEKNVNLSLSPSSIDKGDSTTITWSTTGITSLSFNNGVNATGLSGSVSVSPNSNTTYTMTATDGKTTISCPVSVNVDEDNGGGGGSSSPTCELSISDTKINRGEEVKLKWESSRATNLKLVDNKGKTLVTTENLLGDAKKKLFDGNLTVKPTSDTTYTLIVERGSRDRECKVKVNVEDVVVVSQVRDQKPLVAGIALTDVPYTGFEAGPILTFLFYVVLMLWALYVAYLIVIRRNIVGGYQLAMPTEGVKAIPPAPVSANVVETKVDAPAETIVSASTSTPVNLPTGLPVVGYANYGSIENNQVDDEMVTQIENYAHTQKVLMSGDAIRHFISTTNSGEERMETLTEVVKAAKSNFPAEDGWVVVNETRMKEICAACSTKPMSSDAKPYIPTVIPEGSGSLAEAIVTGNVVAAYEMIGNRPMFALADAASDLDSVVRARKGGKEVVSEMLMKETAKLTDEQLLKMIEALTGALDGTYTDEASAVKMAIMKAVKVGA